METTEKRNMIIEGLFKHPEPTKIVVRDFETYEIIKDFIFSFDVYIQPHLNSDFIIQ